MTIIAQWWADTFPQGQQFITILDANQQAVKIAYGEIGQGEPLVLLHGWGTWSYNWRNNIKALSQHFRVICFDAKGCGQSDMPELPEVSGHQIIETQRILDVLCPNEKVHLVGESLGGLVALALAIENPQRIRSLSVLAPAILSQKLPSQFMRLMNYMPLALIRWFDHAQILKKVKNPALRWIHRQHQQLHVKQGFMSVQDIEMLVYPYLHYRCATLKLFEDTQLAANELQQAMENRPCYLGSIQQQLINLRLPTLIIWGEQDVWFNVEQAYQLQKLIFNSELLVIPQCGHGVASEGAAQVNQALLEFCQKH